MNLVDSSAWLAFFADTSHAGRFAGAIQDTGRLLVPTVVMYEVTNVLMREKGEEAALVARAHLQQGTVVDLSADIAVGAATLSLEQRLPKADSMILATARVHDATIWTRDEHFRGLADVKYFPG